MEGTDIGSCPVRISGDSDVCSVSCDVGVYSLVCIICVTDISGAHTHTHTHKSAL